MATQVLTSTLAPRSSTIANPSAARPSRSILRRMLDAVIESQRRRAEREIQHYLDLAGLRLARDTGQEPERVTAARETAP